MSANVALSETFDQWRVKTNEMLVMTQIDGSPNFVKLTNATDSSSNTTGSVITAGGLGIAKSVTIGQNLTAHGNIHANGNITADGNIVLGSADTDTVSFGADIISNIIPDANTTYHLGNTGQYWANAYVQSMHLTQSTGVAAPALVIDSNHLTHSTITIDAEQTTANVIQLDADNLTTASALTVSDGSALTSTRKSVAVIQSSTSATGATALSVESLGGPTGIYLDKNYSSVAAATVYGAQIDLDQTAASGEATINTTGLDIDVNSAGGGSRVGTAIGVKSVIAPSGTALTKYAGIFTGGNTGFGTTSPDAMVDIESTTAQLRLSYDTDSATLFTVSSGGALTIDSATTISGATTISSAATLSSTLAVTGTSTLAAVTASGVITAGNIGANTSSITSGSALDVLGAIAFSSEQAAPTTVANRGFLYIDASGNLYFKNQAGVETNMVAAASGASTIAVNAFTAQQYFNDYQLTSGASVAWDLDAAQVAYLTLGHNATMANPTNQQAGGVYILRITQGSAVKTVSWGTSYKWPGAAAPTMTATAGAVDIVTFTSDGTNMFGSFSGSQNF